MQRLSSALLLFALLSACSADLPSDPAEKGGGNARAVAYCTPNLSVAPLPNTQTGSFDSTGEVCFVVANAGPLGFNCSNTIGRAVTVNGTRYPSCSSGATAPNTNDGQYYFHVSAGGLPWASIAFWPESWEDLDTDPGCTATLSAGQKWSDRYNLEVTVTGADAWTVLMTLPPPEVMIATWNIDPFWPPPGNTLVARSNGSGNTWGVTIKHNGNWTWPAVRCIDRDPAPTGEVDVLVDPYGNNPLVAVLNLRGIEPGEVRQVTVVVSGKDGGQDLERVHLPADLAATRFDSSDLTFPEAGLHVPVIGLHDGENEVRVVAELDDGTVDRTLTIPGRLEVPGESTWLPGIAPSSTDPGAMEPGWTVAEIHLERDTASTTEWARRIAFDERGAVRWALRLDDLFQDVYETFPMARSRDGTFLTGADDTIVEVNELGRILRTLQLPGHLLHHEILQIGADQSTGNPHDLNLLVTTTKAGASTVEDRILELDWVTGAIVQEWDLSTILDPTRTLFTDTQGWPAAPGDWCHVNGLVYSPDDMLIVSCRHQGVAKIDRAGTVRWLLAPHADWTSPWSEKLASAICQGGVCAPAVQEGYEPSPDGSFEWPFGQHSPSLLANGDLLLFDNGASRYFQGGCSSSRAVIYRIDETDPSQVTVRQLDEHVLAPSQSSCFVSNALRLPRTGSFLVQSGGTQDKSAVVREITAEVAADGSVTFGDDVVFDVTLDMSEIGDDPDEVFVYSYRGHRWEF